MNELSDLTKRSYGVDRDWLLRFAPPADAPVLAALFSIEAEVAESLRPALEHDVAHARLQWWREELERLSSASPRHPATRALAAASRARAQSPPDLRGLIEHVEVALARAAFLTRGELDTHFAHWAQSVFRCVTGSTFADAERLAATAGAPLRELEVLAEFSRHARSGRIYVPLGDPPRDHTVWSRVPLSAPDHAVLLERRGALIDELRAAASRVPPNQRPHLRAALLWMTFAVERARHDSSLTAIETAGDPSASQTGLFEPWRRTMRAWRAALALSRERLPPSLVD